MIKMLTHRGARLARRLTAVFLLLMTLAAQALAAPTIVSPTPGSTLPSVAVGQNMSITITSTGGALPLNDWVECDASDPDYAGETGCLPDGLVLDQSFGSASTLLHGAPTTAGTYTFPVSINDNTNQAGVAFYTLVVTGGGTPTLTSLTPNSGSTAGGTSVTLTGTNLTGATGVSFGGALASGFTVNSATSITATTPAHAAGAVNVVVTTPGGTATLTNGYTYATPTVSVGPTTLPSGAQNTAYSTQTITASGAAAPYTFAITSGALPAGLSLSSGGTLSGTPTASGNYNITVTATDANGVTGSRAYSFTISAAPTISVNPTTLPNPTANVAYTTSLSATGGTAPYSYTFTSGTLPAGLSLSSGGTLSGTPTQAGTYNFTVTATDVNSASGSRTYSVTVSAGAPNAGAVSVTVAANSSANPITLNLSGGAATSVAVSSAASHGTATASGTSITYTPTAGYSGADSFTYTATNGSGTSSPATVSLTVNAPTLSITPSVLTAPAANVAYSVALGASGGTAPYSYAITSGALPTGLSVNTSTGLLSGTPSVPGAYNFTVTVTDTYGATAGRAYSGTVSAGPPIAAPLNITVAANSSANAVALIINGGTATSVAVTSAASHGTATASGTSITYSPTPGYHGTDSFTYTATNGSGTSSPATVTVTVAAPTISISPLSLPNATIDTAYSQTISSSGSLAPYSYAISSGSLPAGLSLSPAGALSGTPTVSGNFNFTVTASDAGTPVSTGARAYSFTVNAVPPVAGAVSATVAANSSANPITLNLSGGAATSVAVASAPSHGTATASGTAITYTPTAGYSGADSFTYTATNSSGTSSPATITLTVTAPTLQLTPASLGAGMAGTPYSATLSAAGGTAPYTYSVSSGSLPPGMNLNASSGVLSGTPTNTQAVNVTITVTDANGATGFQAYTFNVAAMPINVAPSSQVLAAGQSATVDLTQGASGGPFTQATVGTVTPASAGRATRVGAFSMRFVPSAAFAGTAIVSFSLENGSGSIATSSVSFIIAARPDPTKDADVIGLLNAQTRAAERFASTQMDNFNRRLEQLHQVSCNRNSFNASVKKDGKDVPLQEVASAVTQHLGGSANTTDEEKRKTAAEVEEGCKQDDIAYWTDGFINNGSTHARGARDNSFTTMGLSAGVDYRLSPTAIAGIGFGYGNDRSDIGNNKTRSDGDALGIATYLSLNLAPKVFVDGVLGYNRISFDSRRYITGSNDDYARGSRDADQLFASLTTSYEYRQGPLSLTPYGRLNASTTRLDAFRERGGGIYGLSYEEQRQQNVTSFLGLRTGYDVATRLGVMTPKVGLAWGHNFSGSSDYKMRYTDQGEDGLLYRLKPDPLDSDFANLDLGVDFNVGRAWQMGFSYKTALGSDERNDSFRIGINGKF